METYVKPFLKTGIKILSKNWIPYSRLILAGDNAGWVLDWEMRELRNITRTLGIKTVSRYWSHAATPQAIFLASQYFLSNDKWLSNPHRIGFSYFHGLPGTGDKGFDIIYENLTLHHDRISRIQVSHSQMRDSVLQTGIASEKVHLIPIGVNLDFFHFHDTKLRNEQRKLHNIPENAFVIGSFQKDGVGWQEGLSPKIIKGPDVFIETLELVKNRIPELFILLTGPARGYVKSGLDRLRIPYRHIFLKDYPDVGRLFSALDLYLVASRQEGGPKAILESMASGVPLVTTRVGQAMDLVEHGKNGWMVEVEDVKGLAHWVNYVYENQGYITEILNNARRTSEANCYSSQKPLWKNFMTGYLDIFG